MGCGLPEITPPDEVCGDGLDNDRDGDTDCDDSDCTSEPQCQTGPQEYENTTAVDIPDNDEMQADLCASPYDRDSNDRRVLWAKDKIKSKYGFSPDFGDAGGLTFAEPVGRTETLTIPQASGGWMGA